MGTDSNSEKNDKRTGFSPPSISLPKGGGAMRGIGEKFAANPVTGTGSMTVPIAVSPGRSGFGPQLSLSYDSGSGNGPFGFGWNLSLPSITRKTDKGLPKYQDADESDIFILSGAEDLVPLLVKNNGTWESELALNRTINGITYSVRRYRPRIEGLFARIERWSNKTDPTDVSWRSISKDNITTWYGKTKNSRISDPSDGSHIFSWLICQSYDDKGNSIIYEYAEENPDRIFEDQQGKIISSIHEKNRDKKSRSANRYIKRIKYGNKKPNRDENWEATDPSKLPDWLFEVVFDYEEGHFTEEKAADSSHHDYAIVSLNPPAGSTWEVRQDPFSTYKAGFEIRTYRLCHRVLMFHHFKDELNGIEDYLVKSTEFIYDQSPVATFITSIIQSGYRFDDDKMKYIKKTLPPLEFKYSKPIINDDVNEIDEESLQNLPIGIDGSKYQLIDLDGEGISGLLTEQAEAWYYKPNLGNGSFGAIQEVASKPSLADLNSGRQQLLDLAGDGQLDLVDFHGPVSGFYERTTDEKWENFKSFESLPNIKWDDPNLRFVDLNGDGHADILITENEVLRWYPSLAEKGFGNPYQTFIPSDEEQGPRLVFADGTQSIYLADMSGSGIAITRILNGEISYWPNLGYGKFGKKVTMDNSPWFDSADQFDQKRIRIADIDGSGTTDIIYLHSDGVSLYFNQSGNGWSDKQLLKSFPQVDNLSSIMTADILGDGTACIVWSSPLPLDSGRHMKYVHLMKEGKPHLLTSVVNNLGAETVIKYVPSTKFYLEDKKNGTPWITRLPFPVHVVERVETYDYISRNRFVTRYTYHHGYFDGIEREFRGFGRVDQWDTEEFDSIKQSEVFPDGSNISEASHVPPVLTKTWFHTGAYMQSEKISRQFENEYFREAGLSIEEAGELLLADTILPGDLSYEEEREACRALKGSMLRQEIYALDKSDKEKNPYTVTEQNFTIKCLQPQENNEHAVFFVHPREAISYHYERISNDPRVGHELTLEADEFGNILKSVSVGYGRRKILTVVDEQDKRVEIQNKELNILLPEEQEKQTHPLITYTESDYTNSIKENDSWHRPLPSEVRTYELTGTELANNKRFLLDDFKTIDYGQIEEINYEANPNCDRIQKRIIERVRILYCKDYLNLPLQICELCIPALPYETYKQAFTSGLLSSTYKLKADDQHLKVILETEGKYRDLDNDGNWWISSGHQQFDKNKYYLPVKYFDPLGNHYSIEYDDYSLLMTSTLDPLGNKISSKNNYRVLQPQMITDSNENRSQSIFDALGLVAGTAIMGAENEDLGDNIERFTADSTQQDIYDFFDDPKGTKAGELLQNATTRIVYDLWNYTINGMPAYAATIAREKHVRDLVDNEQSKLQVSFSYSDGYGREIQRKIQAEAGPVPERNENENIIVDTYDQPVMTKESKTPRWVGNGWTIFNNKGKPIKQYEPFFTDTHKFEYEVKIGVSPTLIYDPLDRVIATLHPNHTYDKVVFDAWMQTTWDVNDTVTKSPANDEDIKSFVQKFNPADYKPTWYETRIENALSLNRWPDDAEHPQNKNIRKWEKLAAIKAKVHADTPKIAYFDTLGRTFQTVEYNKYERTKDGETTAFEEKFRTNVELDIEGNQLWVKDALGRIVMKYNYDMLSTVIHQISMEAGERWVVNNAAGKEVCRWNSRGFRVRTKYDELIRPLEIYLQDNGNQEIMAERLVYGDYHPDKSLKLKTKLYQYFDQSGVVTNSKYDFKGNLLNGERQFANKYKACTNWINLKDCNDINEIKNKSSSLLDGEIFRSITLYDAFNRPVQQVSPYTDGMKPNIIQPRYNDANLLEAVDVWILKNKVPDALLDASDSDQHIITNIDYNAKGQRTKIEYGNSTTTAYDYDYETYRLVNLHTIRHANETTSEVMQELWYIYDPAGNITHIQDDTQQDIYFNNTVVEPHSDYEYDSIYRLINATGREHIGQTNGKPVQPASDDSFFTNLPHPHDGNAMDRYSESYEYDEVGNILKMIHYATNGNWKRNYAYNEASLIEPNKKSNRLSATSLPGDDENGPFHAKYTYDEHGNMTTMPHLPLMVWDYKDQLMACSQQVVNNGGTPEITWYVYDATGQRVRKVTESNAEPGYEPKRMEERYYLGAFEIYREYDTDGASSTLVRESLSVMDDKARVALIETKTFESGNLNRLINIISSPNPLTHYQYNNHLGSSCLELDAEAKIISNEEYFPYGGTSFQSINSKMSKSLKRYRYKGRERDKESGLYYYRARYYSSWLGRWLNCDPVGCNVSNNLYLAFQNSPIIYVDPMGTRPFKPAGSGWHHGRGIAINLDEPKAVGEPGISVQESTERALNLRNRQFLDPLTNQATKGAAVEQSIIPRNQLPPTSVAENPSALISRPNLGGIAEWDELSAHILKKYGSQLEGKTPAQIKNILNRAILKELKNPTTSSGKIISEALQSELGKPARELFRSSGTIFRWNKASKLLQTGAKAINALAVAGAFLGGLQLGRGINKITEGKTAMGVVDIAQGSTDIGLGIGTAVGIKSGAIIVKSGVVAGGVTIGAGLLAAGGLALGFEETRRALEGKKTTAVESTEAWANLAVEGEKQGGFKGFLKQAGGWAGGFFSVLIATGQGY